MTLDANISKAVIDEMARQLGMEADELYKAGFQFFPLIMPVHLTNLQKNIAPYGGTIEGNYAETTLVNNTNGSRRLTVPAGKRWYLFGGYMHNGDNVGRVCDLSIEDTNSKIVLINLRGQAIGVGGTVVFPNTEAVVGQAGSGIYPIPMLAGWDLLFNWLAGGASAGGTSRSAAIVIEVDE